MAARERGQAGGRQASSTCPGTRSPGSSATSASTRRSTSTTARSCRCKSTSSLFRGYSVFMKGKDPRDAHFITSRICGICGDNHAVCSCYAQQMAYGVKPPPLAEWIVNLGEAAEYIFDHIIFQDNLVFVDFCEQMVSETNPSVWAKAETDRGAGRRRPRLQDDRRHHAVVQPVHGRDVPRGAAHEPRSGGR